MFYTQPRILARIPGHPVVPSRNAGGTAVASPRWSIGLEVTAAGNR